MGVCGVVDDQRSLCSVGASDVLKDYPWILVDTPVDYLPIGYSYCALVSCLLVLDSDLGP